MVASSLSFGGTGEISPTVAGPGKDAERKNPGWERENEVTDEKKSSSGSGQKFRPSEFVSASTPRPRVTPGPPLRKGTVEDINPRRRKDYRRNPSNKKRQRPEERFITAQFSCHE